MTPLVTLRQALEDPQLLGASLDGPTWHVWRSLLLAAMGEPLKPDELEAFTKFTERETSPSQRVDELWCCVGRRGGKSRAMVVLAIYLAGLCDYKDNLARGERGSFITREAVEECINRGVHERPPVRAHSYVAFVDPSGGSSDAMR